jgi:rhodanese-related sulfurtransferase
LRIFISGLVILLSMGCNVQNSAKGEGLSEKTVPTALNTYQGVTMDGFITAHAAGVQLVDVRTPAEYAEGHVPGAINVPIDAFSPTHPLMQTLNPNAPFYMVCRSGARSARASQMMAAAGRTVFNVEGGTLAWIAAGQPVE